MSNKRRTFSERITIPIMFFFILHTVVLVTTVLLLAGPIALIIAILVGLVSAATFGILLRKEISRILSFSLRRVVNIDHNSPKLSIRDEDQNSKEDIAMLYVNFSEVISNFNTLQMDIGAMADDHLKGVHSTTIDESKYKGATLEVVRRVNAMVAMNVKK